MRGAGLDANFAGIRYTNGPVMTRVLRFETPLPSRVGPKTRWLAHFEMKLQPVWEAIAISGANLKELLKF